MNNTQQCPACSGRRIVNNQRGQAQTCPLCEGSGSVSPQPIRVPFWLACPTVALAGGTPGAVTDNSVKMDSDAPFEWVWLVANSTGIFDSQLTDGATQRPLDNDWIKNLNRFGTAQLPFPIVEPYIFAPSAQLIVKLRDQSNGTNTVQIVLIGFKMYSAQSA